MSKAMKAYLRDHLRDRVKPLVYITAIALVITFAFAIDGQITTNYRDGVEYTSLIGIPVTLLIICAYVIPVMEFSIFKKRVNLDCLYALPIKRRELGVVHYITGLMMLVIPYTLSYLLNALLLLRAPEAFTFEPLIPHYFACLALGVSQYAVFVFVFHKANTKGDGICFIGMWSLVVGLVCSVLWELDIYIDENNIYFGIIWGLSIELTHYYRYLVEGFLPQDLWIIGELWNTTQISWFVFWILAGIAATAGYILDFGKQRAEKTGEISDSVFGYKVLIPVYAVTYIFGAYVSSVFILGVVIEIAAIVGYTVYRRGFHYKKSDIIILILLAVLLFVLFI